MRSQPAIAAAVVLDGHVHSSLHVHLVLLLQLALVADVVRAALSRIHGSKSIAHAHELRLIHHLSVVRALVHAAVSVVVVGLSLGCHSHLPWHVLALSTRPSSRVCDGFVLLTVVV